MAANLAVRNPVNLSKANRTSISPTVFLGSLFAVTVSVDFVGHFVNASDGFAKIAVYIFSSLFYSLILLAIPAVISIFTFRGWREKKWNEGVLIPLIVWSCIISMHDGSLFIPHSFRIAHPNSFLEAIVTAFLGYLSGMILFFNIISPRPRVEGR
jgi:ACR3 family arsenite efflux pump ArsB